MAEVQNIAVVEELTMVEVEKTIAGTDEEQKTDPELEALAENANEKANLDADAVEEVQELDDCIEEEQKTDLELETLAENASDEANLGADVVQEAQELDDGENSAEKALAHEIGRSGRGRGGSNARGKSKAKGRGKKKVSGKAKSKAMAAIEIMEDEEDASPNPQPERKLGLKQRMEAEIGNRDIDEIMKEAKEQVAKLQEALKSAQQEAADFEVSVAEGKSKMDAADGFVNECIEKETLAFEKFKEAREAVIDASNTLSEKKVVLATDDKVLAVLVSEVEMRSKESGLHKAKDDAAEVAAAARNALKDAKLKEKEAAEAIKKRRCTADSAEVEESMKDVVAKEAEQRAAKLEVKQSTNAAEKSLKDELKELEKARLEREKSRANAVREAAGFGKIKKRAMLTDGSAVPSSPAKVAKTEEPIA